MFNLEHVGWLQTTIRIYTYIMWYTYPKGMPRVSLPYRTFVSVVVFVNYLSEIFEVFLIVSIVRDTHGGGWSRKINARYLHTLMIYL